MGFLDKLGANLTNESRKLSQKVKNSTDASKLMSEITAENKNIQENLTAIGKLYYDVYREEPEEAFREMVDAITKSEQRITELQESIRIIRAREPELVPVPEDVPAPARTTAQAKPSAMVCMGCGNTYPGGTAFCSVCGQKLVPQYQDAAAAAAAPAQTAADVQVQPEEPITEEEKAQVVDAEIVDSPAQETEAENIPDDATKFCPYCGKKIETPGQQFCENCGHAV